MGCFSGISQIVLVFFNTVFVIVALIMFVAGIILRFFPGVFLKFLFYGISAVVKESFSVPDNFNDLANVPIFNTLGLAAIVLAVILFVIAFLACCGACYKLNIILGAFCALVVIMVLSIATVGGLMLSPSSPVHNTLKSELTKEVRSDYKGPTSADVFSLAINVFSYSLDCCAMQGPNDFDHNATWTYQYKYKEQKRDHIDISPACCKGNILNNDNPDFSCARKTSGSGSSMKFDEKKTNTQGCYDRILNLIHDNQKYPIIIIVVLIAVLLLSVAISVTGGIFNFSPNFLLDLFIGNPDDENVQSLPAHTGYTPVFSEVGVALMVVGVAMCILSFLACIGGCCKCRGLLIAFAVFNTMVVCAVTITAAMFMDKRSDLHTAFEDYLSDTVRSLYEKDSDGFFIKILSAMSSKFDCCGVTGPGDLDPNWMVDPDKVMTSCCKSLSDTGCPSDIHDIYQEGCYETIRDLVLENNKTWITLLVSSVLVVMSLQTVTASAIVLDNHRNKVEPN